MRAVKGICLLSNLCHLQAPSSMKSVLQAAWLLTIAVGNIIVLVVAQFSGLVQVWIWGKQDSFLLKVFLQLPLLPFHLSLCFLYSPLSAVTWNGLDTQPLPGKQIYVSGNNDYNIPMWGEVSEPSLCPAKVWLNWWSQVSLLPSPHPVKISLVSGFSIFFSYLLPPAVGRIYFVFLPPAGDLPDLLHHGLLLCSCKDRGYAGSRR